MQTQLNHVRFHVLSGDGHIPGLPAGRRICLSGRSIGGLDLSSPSLPGDGHIPGLLSGSFPRPSALVRVPSLFRLPDMPIQQEHPRVSMSPCHLFPGFAPMLYALRGWPHPRLPSGSPPRSPRPSCPISKNLPALSPCPIFLSLLLSSSRQLAKLADPFFLITCPLITCLPDYLVAWLPDHLISFPLSSKSSQNALICYPQIASR